METVKENLVGHWNGKFWTVEEWRKKNGTSVKGNNRKAK